MNSWRFFRLSREVVLLGDLTAFVAWVVFRRGHLIYLLGLDPSSKVI